MNAIATKKIVTNGTTRRIPVDEPVFLLRGQDQFAAATVRHWAGLVEANGGDAEIIVTARAHADKMDAWPTKKVPDLPKPEAMFVQVPDTTLPEITLPNGRIAPAQFVPAFKVSKYLCTVIDGKATVSPDAVPTVDINFYDANDACDAAGTPLIRESQYLSLSWNLYHVGSNWLSGVVGEGDMRQGLHKASVEEAQANDFEPTDPEEDRWFDLPNGERICDPSGHLFSWVFDDIQGNEKGVIAKPFTAESRSIATAPLPSIKQGIGWQPSPTSDWSGDALIRGGCWYSVDSAGVFDLGGVWPGGGGNLVGFRSTN